MREIKYFPKFMGLCKNLVESTLKEEGCIEYGPYQELENSEVMKFMEERKKKKA